MQQKKLLNIDKYCMVTFPNTHSALKAEKTLQGAGLPCLIMPTPREVSEGCGLAVRFFCEDLHLITEQFDRQGLSTDEFYRVEKREGKNRVVRIY